LSDASLSRIGFRICLDDRHNVFNVDWSGGVIYVALHLKLLKCLSDHLGLDPVEPDAFLGETLR